MTSYKCDPHGLVEETTRRMERNMLLGDTAQWSGAGSADPRDRHRRSRLLAYAAVTVVLLLSVGLVTSTLINPSLLDEAAKYAGVSRRFQKQPPRLAQRAPVAQPRHPETPAVTRATPTHTSSHSRSPVTAPVAIAAANTPASVPDESRVIHTSTTDANSPLSWFVMEAQVQELFTELYADLPPHPQGQQPQVPNTSTQPFYSNPVLDRQLLWPGYMTFDGPIRQRSSPPAGSGD